MPCCVVAFVVYFFPLAELEGPPAKAARLEPKAAVAKAISQHVDAPSSFAKPATYAGYVQTDDAAVLRIHRPYQFSFPPCIMDPILGLFEWNCTHLRPDQVAVDLALDLIDTMSGFFKDEDSRATAASAVFRKHGLELNCITVPRPGVLRNVTTDGGVVAKTLKNSALVLNVEFKNELCSSSADPYLENVAYYSHYWAAEGKEQIRDCCLCPCLLLMIVGPYIAAASAIFTEEAICVTPVTGYLPMLPIPHSETMASLARLIGALKIAVTQLNTFYMDLFAGIEGRDTTPVRSSRFPYPTTYSDCDNSGIMRTFVYASAVPEKLVFLAHEHGEQVAVKYSRAYNLEIHKVLQGINAAPRLRGSERLACGWLMVVMDALPPSYRQLALVKKEVGVRSSDQYARCWEHARRILAELHMQGFVHGDLRAVNVYVDLTAGLTMFIDFDWAGPHIVADSLRARYPLFLNRALQWPDGVADGALIEPVHDEVCLASAFE